MWRAAKSAFLLSRSRTLRLKYAPFGPAREFEHGEVRDLVTCRKVEGDGQRLFEIVTEQAYGG
jgi:hypothetical protein